MNPEVATFASDAISALTLLASLTATVFLIQGAYFYITSNGNPDSLEKAKNTIRNALIGLVLVLSANSISSILYSSFTTPATSHSINEIALAPIVPVEPQGGLTRVLLDAIGSLLQNIVQSATKPITDAILSFLTTTPSLITNSVIFNFWLTILGIVNALFALVIAVIGFQFMSATAFGFEELELRQVLPKLGVAFLGANISIFLIDWVITLCNVLVNVVLATTGGLNQAWIANAFDPANASLEETAFITLIFMILFVILSVVLLLFYITRLITIALGAVLAPIIFLLWALPKFSDFAEISAKAYLTTIFSIFVHVVVIQLASAFLTVPDQVGTNSLISILVGVGMLLTLLKTQSFMVQLMFYNSTRALTKKIGGQIMNVLSSKQTLPALISSPRSVSTPRKVIKV